MSGHSLLSCSALPAGGCRSSGWALVLLAVVLLALVLFAGLWVWGLFRFPLRWRRPSMLHDFGSPRCEVACFLRQPLPGSPDGSELRDESWTVYELTGPVSDGCDVAASLLTRCRGSRLLPPSRCGDFGFVSRHKPAKHRAPSLAFFPAVATGTSRAYPDPGMRLRLLHRHPGGSSLFATGRPRLVVARPRASRSSSHCDERWEVGFDVACLGTPGGFRTSHAVNSTRTF